ncbi:hypothetical protein Cgig2_009878 [Carnegiea gigantea]|uniref:Uncharacterized protein n=1 Tax=Carnegiea gigantea TaxID=171969 RepID=A0A9Q1K9B8_9CARY|nr:hypothetical protein Cgig2_009878 [Carnegiea gigantea]
MMASLMLLYWSVNKLWLWSSQEDAVESVLMLHNANIQGQNIQVSIATYEVGRGSSFQHHAHARRGIHSDRHRINEEVSTKRWHAHNEIWRKKEQTEGLSNKALSVRFGHESQPYESCLRGEMNSEFEECLSRSLVCTSEEPRDLATLASALINGFGQYTKLCALSNFKFILTFPRVPQMEEVLNNHDQLDRWFANVRKWDKSECCYMRRVVIVTDIFRNIEGDLLLSLDDGGCRIFIREVGPAVQVINRGYTQSHSPSKEAMDSNEEVPGFEDLDDELEANKPGFSVSQNGYLEEILKILQHLLPLEDGTTYQLLGNEEQQPPGFKKSTNNQPNYLDVVASSHILASEDQALAGGEFRNDQNGENELPLVFENKALCPPTAQPQNCHNGKDEKRKVSTR